MTTASRALTVATSAPVNEVQTLTVTATGGTFTLAFGGDPTDAIAFDATGATIETALEALDEFAPADVGVTGEAGGPHSITFTGAHAGTNVALITVDDELATGGTVVATVSTPGSPRTAAQRLDTQNESPDGNSYLHIHNLTGGSTIYVGGSDVTNANGYPVAAATSLTVELAQQEALYAVTADAGSAPIRVLETGI